MKLNNEKKKTGVSIQKEKKYLFYNNLNNLITIHLNKYKYESQFV
jgi:hypothetical protein